MREAGKQKKEKNRRLSVSLHSAVTRLEYKAPVGHCGIHLPEKRLLKRPESRTYSQIEEHLRFTCGKQTLIICTLWGLRRALAARIRLATLQEHPLQACLKDSILPDCLNYLS